MLIRSLEGPALRVCPRFVDYRIMNKENAETADHLGLRLYTATVQNRRCWALLDHIVRDQVVITPPRKRRTGRLQEPRLARPGHGSSNGELANL